ncbi:hypothetical protein CYMTET_44123 [Cymbomonas tetramitiformis]|uniref:Uncharacterized protein n=1 Tax=Cymbomonas tetramitiformis TaxID=36881 RepID=A0AAE0EZC5_9CHLO|nr:hypothetical protein CYMTET_44123 [Cymbomonas tetramitiformis]
MDENVKAAHLAEHVTEEMQTAFDSYEDQAFEEVFNTYDRPEIIQGKAAFTYPETDNEPTLRAQFSGLTAALTVGAFTVSEEPAELSAGLVVLNSPTPTSMPEEKTEVHH